MTMTDTILETAPLGFPWVTLDPFLFCVHHLDHYPRGNEAMGPQASLAGRRIGMDFELRDGWRMYHGDVVPGFPRHPHRGFETVTVARQGFIDHSDSLGATARFGDGDTQWMTAGKGIVHSEMFPLVKREEDNPGELFQIWLNLPHADKLVEPHFTMLWGSRIPALHLVDAEGRKSDVRIIAGAIGELAAPSPPPSSWASRAEADVAIWTVRLDPGARWTVPPGPAGVNRMLYYFRGAGASIAGVSVPLERAVRVVPEHAVEIVAGDEETELLILQGRPIGEPVVQHGPFVMTTQREIQEAIIAYRKTEYGGWPWDADGPVHPREAGRFAIHADGRREEAPE